MPSLLNNSVLALCISVMGDAEGLGDEAWGTSPRSAGDGRILGCEEGLEGISRRCRSHKPVPGMLTFRYTPLGPMLTLKGAAPSVALRPWRVRFNLMPGSTLEVLRKRQLIVPSAAPIPDTLLVQPTAQPPPWVSSRKRTHLVRSMASPNHLTSMDRERLESGIESPASLKAKNSRRSYNRLARSLWTQASGFGCSKCAGRQRLLCCATGFGRGEQPSEG
jgi:hypothetical protein